MNMLLTLSAAALVSASVYVQNEARSPNGPRPVGFTVTATLSDGCTARSCRLHVVADQDSDDDGLMDEGVLDVSCSSGSPPGATFTFAGRDAASGLPTGRRDSASGLPSGRRQHQPIRIRTAPDSSSSSSSSEAATTIRGSWDLATNKKARSASSAVHGRPVALDAATNLCRPG